MIWLKTIWRSLRVLQKKARNLYWRVCRAKFASVESQFPLETNGLSRNGFIHEAAAYTCPIICPNGQEHLFENKLHNLQLAASKMQGLVLKPGEIFSFWNLVGPPDEKHGYKEGATFIAQRVSSAVGGGLCQLSGLLHNLALFAGCTILERHCHSIDAYGEGRYIPLGRDATVTYSRIDLCFQNSYNFSLLLKIEITRDEAKAWFYSPRQIPYQVEIEVSPLAFYPSPLVQKVGSPIFQNSHLDEKGCEGRRVSTRRLFKSQNKVVRNEWLGESFYQPTATYLYKNG